MTYFNKNKELKPGYNAYIDASSNTSRPTFIWVPM